MTNERSRLFQSFLEREELNFFETKELDDEVSTVLFRSYIQTAVGRVPLVVILDNSIYTILRVTLGREVVNAENEDRIGRFVQEENSKYKSFKMYIEASDHSLYLDCVYMATVNSFEPELLYVLMNQLVEYIPAAHEQLDQLIGLQKNCEEIHCGCNHNSDHHCMCETKA